ncbi:hypothetical protein ACFQYP_24785 [Nonomuraea antimicrobica]
MTYTDQQVEVMTPVEIRVSMEVVRCLAALNALRWNGHAHQVTIGAVTPISTHCHPAKRHSGTNAIPMDRSISTKASTTATTMRRPSERTRLSSASSGASEVCGVYGSAL